MAATYSPWATASTSSCLQINFSFSRRAKYVRPPLIEFAFPARDHHRCQTIANYVHAGAAHVHQFIYAKNDRNADRTQTRRKKGVESSKQNHERRARHGGHAFGGEHEREHHRDLLRKTHVPTDRCLGSLRYKHG